MIKSMTGYGRAQQKLDGKTYLVEVKSVNHRYFDFACRTPRSYGFVEDKLKSACQARISRGKVDVFVTVAAEEVADVEVQVNAPVLESYLAALREIRDRYGLADDITVMQVARLTDVLQQEKKEEDQQQVTDNVLTVLEEALGDFLQMRENEGRNLYEDLVQRGHTLEELRSQVEELAPQVEAEYAQRLEARMTEILGTADYDRQRLLTEVAVFADKVSITEELVRLKSHIQEYYKLLEQEGPVGRKLDFLIQEMNRESNTIGSKCNFAEITKRVVDLKSELEKIREQIQNIE
ncbi:MAG: YicC/YloC family endoribonuclease [Eubacteriales bacterium]|jgi:uncharacterized protein (TIGR00255 family)